MELLLSEICAAVNGEMHTAGDLQINYISTDTRSIKSGALFIALIGEQHDGHDYIDIAIKKGAAAVICSNDYTPRDSSIAVIKVADTVLALADLAGYYRRKFSIPVIAVTGSTGKTTTKEMITSILATRYRIYSTDKNNNNEIGLSLSILGMNKTHQVAVLELGMSNLGEIGFLSKIACPTIAVITNIGTAHLSNLKTIENILTAKLEILEGLSDDGVLLINGDDTHLSSLQPAVEVVSVGTLPDRRPDIAARDIRFAKNTLSFEVALGQTAETFAVPVLGVHNVTNALLAMACGVRLGLTVQEIRKGLKSYVSPPLRNELYLLNGISIIKDFYNATFESAKSALVTLSMLQNSGRRFAILGEITELGDMAEQAHCEIGRLCSQLELDYVFFLGAHADSFGEGYGNPDRWSGYETRDALLKDLEQFVAENHLGAGDTVLIKGPREMKLETVYEPLKKYINAMQHQELMHLPATSTSLHIDISAMKYNIRQIRSFLSDDVELMAVLKANAYGCGVDTIANIFTDVKYVAVADTKEGVLLKNASLDKEIVILYQPSRFEIDSIIEHDFIAAACDLEFIRQLNQGAAAAGKTARIHIEVDTGAGRLGVYPEDCAAFCKAILQLRNICVHGIFMHYSCADSPDASDIAFTKSQTDLFRKAIDAIESVLGPVAYKHACAGAAIITNRDAHFNMVRPGYILYGYYPSKALADKIELRPAIKFMSKIIYLKKMPAGAPISYNRTFVTQRECLIATVSVGYSDGLSRKLSNKGYFVVNGQRAPIVGTVCMDLTMLDVTDIDGDIRIGDDVAIFDNVNVTVEEIAGICDTIGYEVIAHIEDRVERVESL